MQRRDEYLQYSDQCLGCGGDLGCICAVYCKVHRLISYKNEIVHVVLAAAVAATVEVARVVLVIDYCWQFGNDTSSVDVVHLNADESFTVRVCSPSSNSNNSNSNHSSNNNSNCNSSDSSSTTRLHSPGSKSERDLSENLTP